MIKLLYRVDEVAEMLSCKKSKIYELLGKGELIGHNDKPKGKGLRVKAESITVYLKKYERQGD